MSIPGNVVAFVVNEATEEDLDRLFQALRDRSKALRNAAAATVQVGDVVVFHGISPKALDGLKGTVKSINGKRADVLLDEQSTLNLAWSRTKFAAPARAVTEYLIGGVPLTVCKAA